MSKAVLPPQIRVEEPGRRQIAVSPENQPISLSRPQQPEAGARAGTGPPALEEALRLTFGLAAQTKVETDPQVKPRVAVRQASQVPSAEDLPVALQFNVQVPVEFASPITTRYPVDFAVRFAPQVASRTTARTTPGTVPGVVPSATREASFPVTDERTTLLTCYGTAGYEKGSKDDEDS